MQSAPSGIDGFTLIELIVVMALISLMTALSIPRFHNSFFADQLKFSARKLTGIISEFSQEAVRTRTRQTLIFDLTEKVVRTDIQTDSEQEGRDILFTFPDEVRVVDITTAHGGKQTLGQVKVQFNARGYIDKTYIHLQDDDEGQMTLILSPFLGVIKIVESYVELSADEVYL